MIKIKSYSTPFSIAQKKEKQKNKTLSFGMNPILSTKDKISSTLRPIPSSVYHIGNLAATNIQNNLPQQNLNSNSKNMEPIKVVIGQKKEEEEKEKNIGILEKSVKDISKDDSSYDNSNTVSNNEENNEFYEKDKEADEYLNKNLCTKISSCLPVIGAFASLFMIKDRDSELDKIYGVPRYIDVKKSSLPSVPLVAFSFLHFTFIGSIIATPLAAFTISSIDKIQKENLKKAYHEAFTKEKELQKNETPSQTRSRHEKLELEYEEKLRRQEEARRRAASRRAAQRRKYKRPRKIPRYSPAGMAHNPPNAYRYK